MAMQTLRLLPGVNLEKTEVLNQAGVSISQYVRWREGMIEKRGGWVYYPSNAYIVLSGVPREIHVWQDLDRAKLVSVGTVADGSDAGKLYSLNHVNVLDDITPLTTSGDYTVNAAFATTSGSSKVFMQAVNSYMTTYNTVVFYTPVSISGIILIGAYQIVEVGSQDYFAIDAITPATASTVGYQAGVLPTFTTTGGDAHVTVTLPNHGYVAGEYFPVLVPLTILGNTLDTSYFINYVIDANTFVIETPTAFSGATTATINGGQMHLVYYCTASPPLQGTGYGIGYYGGGDGVTPPDGTAPGWAYGLGGAITAPTFPQVTGMTDWWLDNWGELLIANYPGGPIFQYGDESGLGNAAMISQAPFIVSGCLVAMPAQQIVAWGCEQYGVFDPLLIRWCDSENFLVWAEDAANQAGSYHIPTGSAILRILQGPNQLFVWTDVGLHVGQYVGPPFVWGFVEKGVECGLIAPKAVAKLGDQIFWMSQKQFYMWTGAGFAPLDCSVSDAVFQNFNPGANATTGLPYTWNIRGGTTSLFNEVHWDYPSAASVDGENDMRVTFNIVEKTWDVQPMARTTWSDQNVIGAPMATDKQGRLYQHETGYDAAGVAINAKATTGYFCIGEGQEMIFVDWVLPDFKYQTYRGNPNPTPPAQIQMSFNVTDYPGSTPVTFGPYTFSSTATYIEPRFRGRYVQIVIESNDNGSFWRVGAVKYRGAPDGRV